MNLNDYFALSENAMDRLRDLHRAASERHSCERPDRSEPVDRLTDRDLAM